eukprot:2427418-Rhodomonas_salina.1
MPPDRVAGRASSFSPVYRTKLTPQTCKEGQKECMSPPERKRNVMQTAVSARGMWECRTLAEILEVEGIKSISVRPLLSASFDLNAELRVLLWQCVRGSQLGVDDACGLRVDVDGDCAAGRDPEAAPGVRLPQVAHVHERLRAATPAAARHSLHAPLARAMMPSEAQHWPTWSASDAGTQRHPGIDGCSRSSESRIWPRRSPL